MFSRSCWKRIATRVSVSSGELKIEENYNDFPYRGNLKRKNNKCMCCYFLLPRCVEFGWYGNFSPIPRGNAWEIFLLVNTIKCAVQKKEVTRDYDTPIMIRRRTFGLCLFADSLLTQSRSHSRSRDHLEQGSSVNLMVISGMCNETSDNYRP